MADIASMHEENIRYLEDMLANSSMEGIEELLNGYNEALENQEAPDIDAINNFLEEQGADRLPNGITEFNEALAPLLFEDMHLHPEDCVVDPFEINPPAVCQVIPKEQYKDF